MIKIKNVIRDIIKSANSDPDYFDILPETYSHEEFKKVLNYLDFTHCDKKTLFNLNLYLTDSPYRDLELRTINMLVSKFPKSNFRYLYCLYFERMKEYKMALFYCKTVLETETDERSKKISISVAKRIINKFINSSGETYVQDSIVQ